MTVLSAASTSSTPVLASLSALKIQDEPLRSDHELFDTHLSKPLRIEELSTLLERTTAFAR